MRCPNCGSANEDNANYCERCGKQLKKTINSWKVLFFLLAIISVICAIILYVIIKDKESTFEYERWLNSNLEEKTLTLEQKNNFLTMISEPAQLHVMSSNSSTTVRFCNGIILDPGGTNYYYDYCDSYVLVSPDMPEYEHGVRLQGYYNTESGCDYFDVYEGSTTEGEHLGRFSGSGECDVLSRSGELLIHFYSDYSNTRSGFSLSVSCVPLDYEYVDESPEGDGI